MTTLVAVQLDNDAIVGWDGLSTMGHEQSNMGHPKAVVNNGTLFLIGGTVAAIDMIATLELPHYDEGDERMFIVRNVSPLLRQMFMAEENEFLLNEHGDPNAAVIAVVNGQVFELDSTFSPTQSTDGIYTSASGGEYARGYLYGLKLGGKNPDKDDVLHALHVSAIIDGYSGGALTVAYASKFIESGSK